MKKQASVARLALTLLAITAVVAALLAWVNGIAQPRIEAITLEKTQKAIEAVLPGGYEEEINGFSDPSGLIRAIYASDSGYALEVRPAGFSDLLTMMVGVSREGAVLGIRVIDHAETPGLGAVAASGSAAGTRFRDQFAGIREAALEKDGGTLDAITGATVTSRAVCAGVNAALAWVGENG